MTSVKVRNIEYFSLGSILILSFYFGRIFENIYLFGLNMEQVQKALLLLTVIPAFLVCRRRAAVSQPIIAFSIVLLISVVSQDGNYLFAMKTFVGVIIGWLFLSIKWRRMRSAVILSVIALSPLLSILSGVVLEVLSIYSLFREEYTGFSRLQGASIPSALAMQALFAVFSCVVIYEKCRSRLYLMMLIINFLILIMTGARMGVLAGILILIFGYKAKIVGLLKDPKKVVFFFMGIMFFIGGLCVIFFQLAERTFIVDGGGLNVSGRFEAWSFFLERGLEKMWFGHGLGASVLLEKDIIISSFVVPHNEYIHYFYDGGIVGVCLLLSAITLLYLSLKKKVNYSDHLNLKVLFMILILFSSTDNALSTPHFMVPFALLLSALALRKDEAVHIEYIQVKRNL